MGLFSILAPAAATTTTSSSSGSNAETSSTLSVPTVIQLHAGSPIVWKDGSVPKYAVLSYQAIEVGPPESGGIGIGSNAIRTTVTTTTTHPNLGVWNCRVPKATTGTGDHQQPLVDYLLKIPSSKSSGTGSTTVCFTVDLGDLSSVEPTISLLQDALVRLLIAKQEQQQEQPAAAATPTTENEDGTKQETKPSATTTTTLFHLKSTQFGLASGDKESAQKMLTNVPEPKDRLVQVALMICAVLPSSKGIENADEAEYKEKQSHALVVYHLRRYAAKLNACLCFVQDSQPNDTEGEGGAPPSATDATNNDPSALGASGQQPVALTKEQLSWTWQQFAQGNEVWKDDNNTATEGGETKEEEGTTSATSAADDTKIFGPGKHQEDLIESVLMRNANCPGNWDASKDSLWKALPQNDTAAASIKDEKTTKKKKGDDVAGDQTWLQQLRDSTASNEPTKTPDVKKSKGKSKKNKTPGGDDGVSDFFASLMKN